MMSLAFLARLADFVTALAVMAAVCVCPLLLMAIHSELVAIRAMGKPCECRQDEDRPPLLPRVLPRLRRIGEDAE